MSKLPTMQELIVFDRDTIRQIQKQSQEDLFDAAVDFERAGRSKQAQFEFDRAKRDARMKYENSIADLTIRYMESVWSESEPSD